MTTAPLGLSPTLRQVTPNSKAKPTSTFASALLGALVFNTLKLDGETFLKGHFPIGTLHHLDLDTSDDDWVTFKTMGDYSLKAGTTFYDPYMDEQLVASMIGSNTWILFDSGAAASCCPRDFAPDWPLLPLPGKPPPWKSISGQPLNVYGRKLDGFSLWLHFYVCDVPYSVLSVSRLCCKATRWH